MLLGFKKQGFGQGKIVEMGGKLEKGETPEEAARRELGEECGLFPASVTPAGEVMFQFSARPDWDMHVSIFTTREWRGQEAETDEIRPEWFAVGELPYPRMWADAPHWLPQVLRGESVALHFLFAQDGETIAEIRALTRAED